MCSMDANAKLYAQKLSYRRNGSPAQYLSQPWFIRAPYRVYEPRYACELEPMICGERVFGSIARDIKRAKQSVDIITWGFDPGMVLVRGGAAEAGQRLGDLLKEIATRSECPVKVRILVWHDDVAAQRMMNNMPGYYGRLYPAIGSGTCGFYSDAHRRFNEAWFDEILSIPDSNIHFHVRDIPPSLVAGALLDEHLPEGLVTSVGGIAATMYGTHHQKMILIDYEQPQAAVGYVMGHNSITEFWDTEHHVFRDPRRERIYRKEEGKIRKHAEPDLPPKNDIAYGYRMSERGKRDSAEAARIFIENNSHIAKPFQDVSCRVRGPVLYDLNHNFCQAWQESLPASSLFVDIIRLAPLPSTKRATQAARQIAAAAFHKEMDANFIKRRAEISWKAFNLANGMHNVQLLRTQPLHGEKDVKECYANLTRQMQHYIFIQNQYIQYAEWADHLINCVSKMRKAGVNKPVYVFLLTSTPEKDGMDLPTYEVVKKVGLSETMKVEHSEAIAQAKKGKGELPISTEEFQRHGINVVMCSLWTCAEKESLKCDDYEEIYIHAKVAIVDDAAFTIGSANLNLRSMAMDSELNILSEAKDVAYQLRTALFRQCSGESGPEHFGDMKKTFGRWSTIASANWGRKCAGTALQAELLPFHVSRKPGSTVI